MTVQKPIKAEREVEIPLRAREARFAPTTFDESDNSVEMVWSTGAAVTRFDWWDGEYYDELLSLDEGAVRLDRLNAGAPLLNTHSDYDLGDVIGSVVPASARVENGQGVCRVRLASSPDVADIVSKVREGHIRNVSVGYEVHAYEVVEPGEGNDSARKQMIARDWEPLEVSLVPIPADPAAQLRARESARAPDGSQAGGQTCTRQARTAPCRIIEAPKEEHIMTTGTQGAGNQPAPEIIDTPTPSPITATRILDLCSAERGLGGDHAAALIRQHETEPFTEATLSAALVERYAQSRSAPAISPAITVTADAQDKFREGATNWLLMRSGVAPMIERAAKLAGETVKIDPGEFRGMTNVQLAAEALHNAGVRSLPRDRFELVGQAMTVRTIAQTTSDFPVLFDGAVRRTLQAAYRVTPDTWRRWAGRGSVSDFREHSRYLRGSLGVLDAYGEAGEIKNKPIPDMAKEKVKAGKRGNIISLSRDAIVNDDLSAFVGLAQDLGRAGKLTVEIEAYAVLNGNPTMNDGIALFHASHGNLLAAAAPSVAAFDAMAVAMAVQKDVSGNEVLDIKPTVLLVPMSLGGAARTINDSPFDPDAVNKLQRPNPVGKMFDDIIATARLTGTAYYGFADPSVAPAIEVVFLDGEEEPQVDSREGWRMDGVEWRVRHYFGVGAVNYRSAQKNPGA